LIPCSRSADRYIHVCNAASDIQPIGSGFHAIIRAVIFYNTGNPNGGAKFDSLSHTARFYLGWIELAKALAAPDCDRCLMTPKRLLVSDNTNNRRIGPNRNGPFEDGA
jgi:hypothetical protein